ncbi:MAG: DUF4290 domain-containing protein [Prevotella sp.]|nr:DUF4290 domain-containing protein [Prevotella sp.]MBQ8657496.1 DUF4290 domain-containing protein [Prevotella sp.]
MEIKGLDYNTQREALLMPEYGREVQLMVDHAVSLTDKAERQRCAETIVRLMESKNPQLRENADYQQTLWDHLYLMSRKQLDIDWPYDVSAAEKIHAKPQPMQVVKSDSHAYQRHYGRLIQESLEKLKQMPEGEERDELVRLTANQMKRDLQTWGHGSMDNEKVADDLARYTDGVIQIDLNSFRFDRIDARSLQPEAKRGKRKK